MRLRYLTVIVLLLFLCSCSKDEGSVDKQAFLMGTVVTERVFGENAKTASDEAMKRISEIEARMTVNSPGGEINRMNLQAGKSMVRLSGDTMKVLEKARQFAALSDGAFDITIGPLVKSWGVFTDNPRIPGKKEISELLKFVGFKDIVIDPAKGAAGLQRKGEAVDLGGIAKGYAGDVVIDTYRKYNIKSAFVNLGGNVVTLGSKPDGTPWKIGIQDPRAQNGSFIGVLKTTDKAIATSGDYERYFVRNGKRYHHILDPKTGCPSDSGLISATIVADKSLDADALSTATFVLGLKKGMKLIGSLKGTDAIFITADKKVYVTAGLRDNFKLEENSGYSYGEKG